MNGRDGKGYQNTTCRVCLAYLALKQACARLVVCVRSTSAMSNPTSALVSLTSGDRGRNWRPHVCGVVSAGGSRYRGRAVDLFGSRRAASVFAGVCLFDRRSFTRPQLDSTYDAVRVGAGAAGGSAVAVFATAFVFAALMSLEHAIWGGPNSTARRRYRSHQSAAMIDFALFLPYPADIPTAVVFTRAPRALLRDQYGLDVTVCESHTIPGGCAHSFERDGFKFDSGPSIFSGFTGPVPNPLKQVGCGEGCCWLWVSGW